MKEEALQILALIGGNQNIISLNHCVTRLRLVLKDESLIDEKALSKLNCVKGIYHQNGQFQIVIGPHVKDYYDVLNSDFETKTNIKSDQTPLQKVAALVSEIVAPLIPLIILGGFSSGLENLCLYLPFQYPLVRWLFSLFKLINICAFTFIPVALTWSIVKRFQGSEILAIALGLSMVIPNFMEEMFMMQNYAGEVVPAIFAAFILLFLEKQLKKVVPEAISMIFVPLGSLLGSIVAMQVFFGPIASDINHGLAQILLWCFTSEVRWLIAPLIGYYFASIVKSGLHHFTVPLDLMLISEFHVTYLWPLLALSNIAQGAACYFLSHQLDETNQPKAKSASLSCMLGVSEPAMFGFNLVYQEPFKYALYGSSIACFIATTFKVKAYSIGIGGLPAIFTMVIGKDWLIYLICMVIAIMVPMYLIKTKGIKGLNTSSLCIETNQQLKMVMPVNGQIVALETIEDEVFAKKLMGDGVAIIPTDKIFVAPVSGILTTLFPTGHAYGITTEDGQEILMHIGLNTVELPAGVFTPLVKQGDEIKVGDKLVEVDLEKIKEAHCSLATPLILCNQQNVTCSQINQTLDQNEPLTYTWEVSDEK